MPTIHRFFHVVSLAFHPVFFFTYMYIAYWFFHPYAATANSISQVLVATVLVLFSTAILPIATMFLLGSDLQNATMKQRRAGIFITASLYVVFQLSFGNKLLPAFMQSALWATTGTLAAAFVLHNFAKTSLHTTGIGGVVGIYIYGLMRYGGPYFYPLLLVVILAGLIGSARWYLQAHSPKDLILGYASGSLVAWLIMLQQF